MNEDIKEATDDEYLAYILSKYKDDGVQEATKEEHIEHLRDVYDTTNDDKEREDAIYQLRKYGIDIVKESSKIKDEEDDLHLKQQIIDNDKKACKNDKCLEDIKQKQEILDEEKDELEKKYYSTRGKKDKQNFANEGDKDENNPYMYAKIMQQDMGCIFWTIEDGRLCHIYEKDNGMYDAHGDARIRRIAQRISDEEYRGIRENIKREVINIIKDRTSRPKPKDDIYDHLLLCENGIYDLEIRKFLKGFNPEFFITSRMPWPYNENAKCVDIINFIKEVVVPRERWDNLIDLDRKKILFMQELFGYCLYRRYPFHYMFMLLGRGDNGKGILLRIFKKFVGIENISAVPPHNLDKRFQSANLYGKHINMFGDLPGGKLKDTGTIKTLIGEDTVTAEFKGQDPFSFTSYAKIIVSTNEPFRVSYGEPEAFFRKILPIYFPNRFPTDDNLFEEITKKEQMSGLLNWAIQGLERLLKNKEFSLKPIPKVTEDLFPRFGEKGEFHRAVLDIRDVDITDIDIVYEQ